MYSSKLAVSIFLGGCALAYLRTNVITPMGGLHSDSDFHVYYHAAYDVLNGKSPYENPAYFYPPVVAFVMAPFARTDYVTARTLWFAISHLFMLFAAWLVWRAAGRDRLALCCIALVWAFGGAEKEMLDVGQLSPLLVVAIALAYTNTGGARGTSIGAAFALKYFPGVLAFPLLLQRKWRELTACVAVGAGAVAASWLAVRFALTGVSAPTSARYWMGTPAMFSWSVPSIVLRILSPVSKGMKLPENWEFGNVAATLRLSSEYQWISAATGVAVLLAGLIALAWTARGRWNQDRTTWAMVGLVPLTLAAAPVCWTHYQVLQYPGVALLLIRFLRRSEWRRAAATLLCFGLAYRWPETAMVAYHDRFWAWTAMSPSTLYFWTSVPPLACLGLFTLALMNLSKVRRITPHRQPAVRVLADREFALQTQD